MKYDRIIFVDDDNTCRSPMAEAILKSMYEEGKADFEIMSRGLVVLFEEPFNQKAEMILYNHGLQTSSNASVAFDEQEITEATLILTMTFQEKLKLIEEYGIDKNVYTLKEYVGNDDELLDPYGEEIDIYEACYQDMYSVIEQAKILLVEENEDGTQIPEIINENETEDL